MNLRTDNDSGSSEQEYTLLSISEMSSKLEGWMVNDEGPAFRLLIMLGGQGQLLVDGKRYIMNHNGFVVCPYSDATIIVHDRSTFRCALVAFAAARKIRGENPFPLQLSAAQTSHLLPALTDLMACDRLEELQMRLKRSMLFFGLLYELVKMADKGTPALTSEDMVLLTVAYMKEHCAEAITREQLADMAGLSPWYYSQLFKQMQGLSPMECLAVIRLRKAKERLLLSNDNLEAVAKEAGYANEFYFSRKFKKLTGSAPSVYAKEARSAVASFCYIYDGHLMALEVKPRAVFYEPHAEHRRAFFEEIPYYLAGDAELERNLSILEEARPGLILCEERRALTDGEKLGQIAPVLAVPSKLDWRSQLLHIANGLDKEAEARRWLDRYEQKAAAAGAALRKQIGNETVLIVVVCGEELFVYTNRNVADVLYYDLRVLAPFRIEDMPPKETKMTLEQLVVWNPDWLLLHVFEDERSKHYAAQMKQDSRWLALKAVHQNRLQELTGIFWREYSAAPHWEMLDRLVGMFQH